MSPGDLLSAVMVFLVVLTVIAVVGHGIWVVLAFIFRGGKERPEQRRLSNQRCVFCGYATLSEHRCDWCRRDLRSPLAAEMVDLAAVERQLQRFRASGELTAAEADGMLKRVEEYRRQRLAAHPASPLAPAATLSATPAAAPTRAPTIAPTTPTSADDWARRVEQARTARSAPVAPVVTQVVPETAPSDSPEPTHIPTSPHPIPATAPVAAKVAAPVVAERQPAPPPPRRSWTEMLAGFMEERNIRWGELVGGLLVVCCSVALVVSLWNTLEKIPYFQFFIFVAISSAVFGVGLYAHHRWQLRATSQGMLLIAMLLVPLNFVVIAVMVKEQLHLAALAPIAVALGLFAWLVSLAARVLVPTGRWLTVAAVIGNSAAVLAIGQLIDAQSPARAILAAGGLCVGLFAAGVLGYLRSLATAKSPNAKPTDRAPWAFFARRSPRQRLQAGDAAALFTLLGVTAFAMLVALGLLVTQIARPPHLALAIQRLSLLAALAAGPVLAAGLTVHRGIVRDATLAAYRLAGTTVALVAMAAMLGALGMAWPVPGWIVAVGTFNMIVLALAALGWRLPALHVGAIACAALAYLTTFHRITGDVASWSGSVASMDLLRAMVGHRSGTSLAGMFLVLAAVSELLARTGRRRHGRIYLGGSAVVAVAGLSLVTFWGIRGGTADALRAAILYAAYGISSLGLVARWRRIELSYLGITLLAAAPLWLLYWHPATHEFGPLWAAVVAGEALALVLISLGLSGKKGSSSLADLYRRPLAHLAEIGGGVALALGIASAADASQTPAPIATTLCLAAVCFLMAWHYRTPLRTWAGSLIVLAGALHTLVVNYPDWVDQPWLMALLGHATVAALAGMLGDAWVKATGRASAEQQDALAGDVRRVLSQPLCYSALLSSILSIPALMLQPWPSATATAVCLFWLSAVWGVLAWRQCSRGLFAAHQAVLTAAVVATVTAWLERAEWITDFAQAANDPRNLQAYGIGLGLLSLGWIAARTMALRRSGNWSSLLQDRPSVDLVVRHLVVAAHLALVAICLGGGVLAELTGVSAAATDVSANGFGGPAWILSGTLAMMLASALWERWRQAELLSSLCLVAAIAGMVAGRFADDLAVASALRWSLAIAFLACSVALWQRQRLAAWCVAIRANVAPGPVGPAASRAAVLATMALPVVGLTLLAAGTQLLCPQGNGPVAGTFFARLGATWSYLVPLLLLIGTLVGTAIRERSAAYAFAAGLVLEMAVVLGYALHTQLSGGRFDARFFVVLLQLATIAAALWGIAWLIARRWLDVWRERELSPWAAPPRSALMNFQINMAWAGNIMLLAPALLILVFAPLDEHAWSMAAGGPLGWLAFFLPVVALRLRGRLRPDGAALFGMSVVGLAACTIRGLESRGFAIDPFWGYRTLMLGWAGYAWLVVVAAWWTAVMRTRHDTGGPSRTSPRMAGEWVRVAALLAVWLALKAAWGSPGEQLWSATAIALVTAAAATTAIWRQREGWAFAAAAGVNLATSLVVWHFELLQHHALETYWLRLLQANIIASATVALAWLAARPRLYRGDKLTLGNSPLLAVQLAVPAMVNYGLLMLPVLWMVVSPGWQPEWMAGLGAVAGWIGFGLTAAAWYARGIVAAPRSQGQSSAIWLHVLSAVGLGTGVLAACSLRRWYPDLPNEGGWLAYHILISAWAATATLLLAAGILGRPRDGAAPATANLGLAPSTAAWLAIVGALSVGFALLHGFYDPFRPWCSVRVVAAIAIIATLAALWLRRAAPLAVAALLANAAGILVWWAWGPGRFAVPHWDHEMAISLVQTNVLCLAITTTAWSLLGWMADRYGRAWLRKTEATGWTAQLGTLLVGATVAVGLTVDLAQLPHLAVHRLDWIALGAMAAAVIITLVEGTSRRAPQALYGLVLAAIGMTLWAHHLGPRGLCWSAVADLSNFALAMAAWGWALWQIKRSPRVAGDWFSLAQATVIALVAGLGAWVALDFAFDRFGPDSSGISGRWAGPMAIGLGLVAAILMTGQTKASWRAAWQHAAYGLGTLTLAAVVWALLGVKTPAPWLHRNIGFVVSAALMTLLIGRGLAMVMPVQSDWRPRGRRHAMVLAVTGITMLMSAMVHEGVLFELSRRVPWELPQGAPVQPWAIVAVALVLFGLGTACIAFAVRGDWDPFRRSDRDRQIYVYSAELVATMIGMHVRFAAPWLFRGHFQEFWMFLVLVIAFLGAGLGEWFQRRKLSVLSQPLAHTAMMLPLIPALLFWLMPEASGPLHLANRTPAVWFTMGLIYAVMATSQRNRLCWLLAALTANVGLWVLWHEAHIGFLEHPQLWLIPLALAALVAELSNRNRLSAAQSAAVRYFALGVIYVASSADMYIAGVGKNWLLPLILMGLSVTGVLAGILLRVRSFLYLGVVFLLVDIMSILWYAAVDLRQTWIWYASGIALGAAIIALFAVFEKRRNDVLATVERLKEWRP